MTDSAVPGEPMPALEPIEPEPTPAEAEPTSVGGSEPSAPPPPPPRPRVWPGVGAVLSGSLDLVTQSRIPLRNASLYIGLLGVLTTGPSMLALIAPGVDLFAEPPSGVSGWTALTLLIASLAIVAIGIEAEIIGIVILGGARAGRPMTLIEALRRSRQVFWRVVRASIVVGIATYVVSLVLQVVLGGIFGEATDAAPIGAGLLAAVITAPFIYVPVGIVVGDVQALESIRRSIRLARARFRLAVVASLFSVVAQFLLVFAASAGVDLVLRGLEPFRGELETLDTANAGGFAVIAIGGSIALFAYWTLTFTVGALTAAPQVVAFLGLTGYSRGLDGAREAAEGEPARDRPARISRPMAIGVIVAAVSAVLAITSTRS